MNDSNKITKGAQLLDHHPLFTKSMILQTNPAIELFQVIKSVVMLREAGCCFEGGSGTGKTFAIEIVTSMLKEQTPNLYVLTFDMQTQQMPSIRAFFKRFLSTIKHKERKGETCDLRERVVISFIDSARASGINVVVLFIDEASSMRLIDFDFLKDVYNDLSREGIQLITILMGQAPNVTALINQLYAKHRLDIIGRFAMRKLRFRAFNSDEDLRLILKGIDEAEYPAGSSITWTQAFFPEAYGSGFRLENQTQAFFNAIVGVSPNRGDDSFDYPTRQLFDAIRRFVVDMSPKDCKNFIVLDKAWQNAVDYSRISQAMAMEKSNVAEGYPLEI